MTEFDRLKAEVLKRLNENDERLKALKAACFKQRTDLDRLKASLEQKKQYIEARYRHNTES